MGWLFATLLLVWLVPPLAAVVAALAWLFSRTARAWLTRELFGDGSPNIGASPDRPVSAER